MDRIQLTSHDRLRVAVAAVCAEISVRRYLADPSSVSESIRIRIERALRDLGLMI